MTNAPWGKRAQELREDRDGVTDSYTKGDDNGPELNDIPKDMRKVRRGLGLEPQETPGI